MSTIPILSPGSILTIEDLLQLPRPQSAILSPNGKLSLWPSTKFSFPDGQGKGRTEKSIHLIQIPISSSSSTTTTTSTSLPKKILEGLTYTDACWIDDKTFLYLRPPMVEELNVVERGLDHAIEVSDTDQKKKLAAIRSKEGGEGVEIWAKDVEDGTDYQVGSLPVPISNLKISQIKSETEEGVVLAFSASVYADGDIFSVAANKKRIEVEAKGSDVRVYDNLFVRHWDTWKDNTLNQIFFLKLTKNPDSYISNSDVSDDDTFVHVTLPKGSDTSREGKWTILSKMGKDFVRRISVKSPMAGTTLECPVGPFGGSSDFSISSTHLLFHSKDPLLNLAYHTRTQVYLVPLFPRSASDAKPKIITIGTQGACASPTLSQDGKRIAWLEMRKDGNEADRHRVMIYEIESTKRYGVTEEWDRSPSEIVWCPCNEKIYLLTEEEGHVKIFQLPVPVERSSSEITPESITSEHVVTSLSTISTSQLLVTSNSFTHPNVLSLLKIDPSSPSGPNAPPTKSHLSPLATLTPDLSTNKSLSKSESFWFPGNEGIEIHGFILFPPGFEEAMLANPNKKYPLAFLVHGGPESAWTDSFSTRWNPNIYAARGFITVAINPTGSTGYGQELTDAIKNQWGGKPFQDLVAGLNFVKSAYPIDSDRMAMLGASYGGYMANWINGHNDQMGFKCIVCHDGVFSTSNTWYSTEELYFPETEFGGTPWEQPENYSRWNPQNHIKHWKTPELVIHGGRDYRLTESEGLGVFNTLQRLGVPSRFVYFESENHWVLAPHNGVRWHEEVFKWIEEWTKET